MPPIFQKFQDAPYPDIADYAYISDCHSSGLVSRWGSIDWCCMPRIDSGSCFGRLVDWEKGGYCRIAPRESCHASREYLEGTLVLQTLFRTEKGECRLLDCFTMHEGGEHHPHQQILRIIEGIKGKVEIGLDLVPCFDYGTIRPWLRRWKESFLAMGGEDGLMISGDFHFVMKHRHHLTGTCSVREGERRHLSILYRKPEELDEGLIQPPDTDDLDRRLEETIQWWRKWVAKAQIESPYREQVLRSAIVLKGLSNAPTGAIAAAPTTSLPEAPGGSRNWDYRFSWVRDSYFTVRSLAVLGCEAEADGFRRFIERSSAGSAEETQILFGVGGERRLHEFELEHLEGYQGARPVRIGNAAETQVQLDLYGELLDLAWIWHKWGHSPDDDYWEFLVELVNKAGRACRDPDRGIWEMRGKPRHFIFSKAMCWVALDRGLRLANDLGRKAPLEKWEKTRDEILQMVEERGYDPKRGIFIQAFDLPVTDAALLLLPVLGFVGYRDERMVRTAAAIREDLCEDGLVRRYSADNDGLDGEEGTFLACSFWLAECLARQGQMEDAHKVFQRALSTGNDLGLFSEEFNTATGKMLGNFPQGLTHLSQIAAAVALTEMEKGRE
jgi:GH15 family glucan-1,4-alpha-glucosidase